MNEEYLFIFIYDEGVLGLGKRRAYGVDAIYFIDSIPFERALEHDEFIVWSEIDELKEEIIEYFEL